LKRGRIYLVYGKKKTRHVLRVTHDVVLQQLVQLVQMLVPHQVVDHKLKQEMLHPQLDQFKKQ
jgi:hypothetical protein